MRKLLSVAVILLAASLALVWTLGPSKPDAAEPRVVAEGLEARPAGTPESIELEEAATSRVEPGVGARSAVGAGATLPGRTMQRASPIPQGGAITGVLRDALTGEPVPAVRVRASDQTFRGSRRASFSLGRTDGEGRFELRVERGTLADVQSVAFTYVDEYRGGAEMSLGRQVIDRPPFERFVVTVGPTFTFDRATAERLNAWTTTVQMEAVLSAGGREKTVYGGVKAGDRPWVRFRAPIRFDGEPEVLGTRGEPYILRVPANGGMVEAFASTDRRAGLETRPVALVFEERGAVEFVLQDPGSYEESPDPTVTIRSLDGAGTPLSVGFRRAAKGGLLVATRHLAAGNYDWELMDANRVASGRFVVLPLEPVRVEIRPEEPRGPALRIPVDTSQAPGADLSQWQGSLTDLDGLERRVTAHPTQARATDGGQWYLEFARMPGKRHFAHLSPGDGYRVVPTLLSVVPGADSGGFRVEADRAFQVDLLLVERGSAQPVAGGSIRPLANGSFFSLRPREPGRFSGRVVEGQLLGVDAPGYSRTIVSPKVADLTRGSITVELAPSEESLVPVMVLDGTSMSPVGGISVLVGGRLRGTTDPASGAVGLEPTCEVAEIKVRLDPKRYKLAMRPDVRGETLADASFGAMFIVLPVTASQNDEDQ